MKVCHNGNMGHIKLEIIKQKIDEIVALIDANPSWHRTRLSVEICELWDWRGPNGQLKDISCRDMLRDLDAKGKIKLPKALRKGGYGNKIMHICHETNLIDCSLKELMPIHMVETFMEQNRFRGTCYKDANWIFVGSTTGRGRNSVRGGDAIPIKDIYIYSLTRNFQKKLCMENSE